MTSLPPPPSCSFSSDNAAGAHPAVIEALQRANHGHVRAYGADPWTAECAARFRELFGPDTSSLLVWNGTGANVVSLATAIRPAECVLCTANAHIAVDEAGAPERFLGAKLFTVPGVQGKLTPSDVEALHWSIGDEHHVQPGIVSLTQSTELGTLYSAAEIAAVCEAAHKIGMKVHMDGARIANATAALGGSVSAVRAFTVDAGVDVVSFGGTKAGLAYGEAVVFLDPVLAERARFIRKQTTQLPSKMRFIAAQFNALLEADLWIHLAHHANAMTKRLYDATSQFDGVEVGAPPQVNSMFPVLARPVIEEVREWCHFWDWDAGRNQVRWMTAWDTTEGDVDRFAAGVAQALANAAVGPS